MSDWWNKPDLSPAGRSNLYGPGAASPSSVLPGPDYDPAAHYAHVKKLHDEYPLLTEEQCLKYLAKHLAKIFKAKLPNTELFDTIGTVFYQIFQDEGLFEPTLLECDNPSPTYAQYGLRPYYTEAEEFYSNKDQILKETTDSMVQFISSVASFFPETAYEEPDGSTPTIPLLAFLPAVEAINDTTAFFCRESAGATKGNRKFYKLSKTLTDNVCRASGLDPENLKPNARLVMPTESDDPPPILLVKYLADTPFIDLFSEPLMFKLPEETRFSGHWIISPTGRGKTNLMHSMLRDDLKKQASIILMDSKGELIRPIQEMKELKDRLVIIEPDPDYPLALNPLDIPNTTGAKKLELLEYIVASLLGAMFTPLQKALLRNLLPAIIQCVPHPTLEVFRDIIQRGIGPYQQHFQKLSPLDRRFFDTQFMSRTYTETREQLMWRIDLLMSNQLMRAMFNSPKTKFDIAKQMNEGKVIIINAHKNTLGNEGSEFYQRFFIALILAAAQQRRSLPCYFYIDECHTAIATDENITIVLDECRSQRIATVLAHQRLHQIISRNVLSALKNCAIRMTNADDDAPELEDSFRIDSSILRSLRIGQFATWTREMGNTPAITLNIPLIKFDQPKLFGEERAELRDRMRREFCNPVTMYQPPPAPAPAPAADRQPKKMKWRK